MSHYQGLKFSAQVILSIIKYGEANPNTYIPSPHSYPGIKIFKTGKGLYFKTR